MELRSAARFSEGFHQEADRRPNGCQTLIRSRGRGRQSVAKNPKAEGASQSLNKTIREIEDALSGFNLGTTTSPLRAKLRSRISHLARYWFRRGFKRGCIESNKSRRSSKQTI